VFLFVIEEPEEKEPDQMFSIVHHAAIVIVAAQNITRPPTCRCPGFYSPGVLSFMSIRKANLQFAPIARCNLALRL
jgi:hypothetical protein